MNIVKTGIEGVLVIEPRVFGDARGYFFESFNARDFAAQTGVDVHFVQDNESRSCHGVVRGLHFQRPPYAQAKLVRVVEGEVLDVAVDIRRQSTTYGQHVATLLSADNHRQFFIPKGFAHGFAVLSETAVFQYKCDEYYHPEAEGAIAWDDPTLAIDWHLAASEVLLSEKDSHHPLFNNFDTPFTTL
ncbi:MAG: dTDP-4-dehydrorhamnose 3,5-epimerase [Bacteroidales bacterium]|nr:dTDP-4-dehydrorhamnose 3,5-epimerase [Bacteroidales bacterium]